MELFFGESNIKIPSLLVFGGSENGKM